MPVWNQLPQSNAPSFAGQAQQQIQGAQAAGFFSPTGSPQIMSLTRRNALRNSDNARRRAALLSRLMGLDPNQARVAAVHQDAASSGATQDALNAAQYGQLEGAQNYARGLFNNRLGYEDQRNLLKYQQDLANQGQTAAMFGQLAGRAIPAFFGAP